MELYKDCMFCCIFLYPDKFIGTEILYPYTKDQVQQVEFVIVEDFNARSWSKRWLMVPRVHEHSQEVSEQESRGYSKILHDIVLEKTTDKIARMDLRKHKFPEHYHIQACIE